MPTLNNDNNQSEVDLDKKSKANDEIDGYMAKNDVGEEVKDREEGVDKLEKKGFASSVNKSDSIQGAMAKIKQHEDITGAEEEATERLMATRKQLSTKGHLSALERQELVSSAREKYSKSPLFHGQDTVDGPPGPSSAPQQQQQAALLFQQQQQQTAPTQPEQQQQMGL
ncbi:hypothetical protein [Piscirickettsia salmonis]|uniref:hypothetical protein n=1 Tax=Piscirickettsia salmonis TaxID=1238 RepID=UPI0007D7B59A|nr:hypothetical protein A0O36_00284 [Piscirickettsiaceae bacterium NZ-RLO1]